MLVAPNTIPTSSEELHKCVFSIAGTMMFFHIRLMCVPFRVAGYVWTCAFHLSVFHRSNNLPTTRSFCGMTEFLQHVPSFSFLTLSSLIIMSWLPTMRFPNDLLETWVFQMLIVVFMGTTFLFTFLFKIYLHDPCPFQFSRDKGQAGPGGKLPPRLHSLQ